MIDWVHVAHAILNNATSFLQAMKGAHDGDGITLDEEIAAGEELNGFEGASIRPDEALTALGEAVFVAEHAADLDNVAVGVVVEDLQGLRRRDATREKLEEVTGFQNNERVGGFLCGADGHGALNEVELTADAMLFQRAGN